ncbi:MAG: stage II sporulation protein D [Clostridia bacterium]|nr:stage II sporulation protein D [Clostridia bacterium]
MRKFLVLILFVFCVVIILPGAVIIISNPQKSTQNQAKNEKTDIEITVKNGSDIEKFNIEDYLFGVLAAEMPASFHPEALKAQAVAARTYIMNKMQNKDADHPDADVCTDPTHCKAYLSETEIKSKFGDDWIAKYSDKIRDCIAQTAGEIAVYNGEPIEAVFHSTGSGKTENARDVWGGDVPYLVSVDSPGDLNSPNFYSEITVSKAAFKSKIAEATGNDCEAYIGDIAYNDTGSVRSIDLGGNVFSGTEVRKIFNLPSTNFTVEDAGDSFVFHTKGKGHGVGMSQYGAEYFAESGMTYKDILKKYYKGIEIQKYDKNN